MRGIRQGSLQVLLAALLVGILWRGAYFPTPDEAFGFPASLLTPRWSFVALLILAGAWELVLLARERRRRILASPLLWLFGGYVACAALTRFWSIDAAVTTRDSLLLLAYFAVLLVAAGQLLRAPERAAAALCWWLVYTASFLAAWGIVTYIVRLAPYANQVDGIYRAGGTLEYSNALGCFALMALPLAAAMMAGRRREDRLLLALAQTLLTAAVLVSLSRLALLLLAGVAIYMLAAPRDGNLALRLSALFWGGALGLAAIYMSESGWRGAGVTAAGAILLASHLWQRFSDRADPKRAARLTLAGGAALLAGAAAGAAMSDRVRDTLYERFGEGMTFSSLLPHRLDTYSGAMEAFRERTAAGWGLGSFAGVYRDFAVTSYTKYAHNLVLQAAVETGVIGASLMGLFLLFAAALGLIRIFTRPAGLSGAAGVGVLIFICYNMFDWEWYVPALTAWFMVLAALAAVGPARLKAMEEADPDRTAASGGQQVRG